MQTATSENETMHAAVCIWQAVSNAAAEGYWCGELTISGADAIKDSARNEKTTYLQAVNDIVVFIGASEEVLLAWHVSGPVCDLSASDLAVKAWAFVWWRLFWEDECITTLLTRAPQIRTNYTIHNTFYRYFSDRVLPVWKRSLPQRILNSIVLGEVLRATYANAYRICRESRMRTLCFTELIVTPMPVFLVTRTGCQQLKIHWAHHKDLSFAKNFF